MAGPYKYWKGRRVEFYAKNEFMRGWVYDNSDGDIKIRGIDGNKYSSAKKTGFIRYEKSTLNVETFGIRVFDTILSDDGGDSTSRRSHAYWEEFCKASGWSFGYERIHSITDLNYFFDKTFILEPIIIFNGHGLDKDDEDESLEKGFSLSNGEVINENSKILISEENKKKIIIFSSCLIGNNKKLSEKLKTQFGAEALFAYKVKVYDNICFLIESYLLTLLNSNFDNQSKFKNLDKIFTTTKESTDIFKTFNKPNAKSHPLVKY